MLKNNIKTPGVYINELNGFPNSVVPVATAIPAFIGYTPKASYEGKSYSFKPVKITSFQDFQAYFMLQRNSDAINPPKQYAPSYYLTKQKEEPVKGGYMELNGAIYTLDPDPNTVYYLYNSVRSFYENGGGDAYIVSVGGYGVAKGKPISPGGAVVNENVKLADIQKGLELLINEQEPTMYIVPEATLLSAAENATLMQKMLLQSEDVQTVVSILDIIGGDAPDHVQWMQDITNFRNNVGNNSLKYGTSYYPFVGTTITSSDEVDYTNLNGGAVKQLKDVLSPADNPNSSVEAILKEIENPTGDPLPINSLNSALKNASKTYQQIETFLLNKINLLPPSGVMAGVMTTVDTNEGVWQAPANVTPVGVTSLPIYINNKQQEDLNVDAISGKSINAIRFFNGQGILIWGARTLDGNSQDWRYLNVRRTMTFIEQSVKAAARAYVFQPNDSNTWIAVKTMIDNFLTSIWKEGALQGSTPEDAFSVAIGLGSTMTAQDILNGFMNVTVKLAVVRPAEFIVLTFQQQQAKS